MKRLICMLTIAVVGLSTYGQSRLPAVEFPNIKRLNSNAGWDESVRSRSSASSQRAAQNIVVDPFQYDAILTADSGGVFEDNNFVELNTNFDTFNTALRFSMTWAAQIYDTLIDVNTLSGYPYAITPVHLDSVDYVIAHENVTGTPDTIIFTVYQHQGTFGIQIDFNGPEEPIANTVLYSDTVITTTSLSPAGQYSLYTIYPNIDITGNKKFVLAAHFYGDTTNTFGLRVGYGDRCGQACVAYPSVNQDKAFYRMVHFQTSGGFTQNFTGVYSNYSFGLVFDCNQNGEFGERVECEYMFIQNYWMTAYITVDAALSATIEPTAASICPNNTVALEVTPIGGTGPYTVTWSPTTGLSNPFGASTNATVGATTTYTATVIDADSDTITKSVTITVNGITIDAGADRTINCGDKDTLVAIPGGVYFPSTYLWSNGVQTLDNIVTLAGTYTITATNSYGCTATDAVVVTIQGVTQTLSFTTNLNNNIGCVDQVITFDNTSSSQGTEWNWEWNFGDGTLSTALEPTYSYPQSGNYTVVLSAYIVNGSDTCEVVPSSKNLTINQVCVGIENKALDNLIEIYPNPTEGVFTLNFKNTGDVSGVAGVYDINGALVMEDIISATDRSQKVFDLSKAADGVYFVKIQVANEVVIKKLTLSR